MKNPEKDGKPEVETWVQDCEEIDDRIVAVRPELKKRGGFVILRMCDVAAGRRFIEVY